MTLPQIQQPASGLTRPVNMRPAHEIMSLAHLGASFPTRLSFMRRLVRKIHNENWQLSRTEFCLNDKGYGHAVYQVKIKQAYYSLIVFSHELPDDMRSDRVIANAWDATFTLFDGIPDISDIQRLQENVPKQEAGRCSIKELVLGRANKSVRLFDHILTALESGQQPDIKMIAKVGYLMRTTAVYGSGKFGCADRHKTALRPEAMPSFSLEMLAVYLFRWFSLDLLDHIAHRQNPTKAVALAKDIKRYIGIGNSTGLGMAPFLVKHPRLLHQWASIKEYALSLSLAQSANAKDKENFLTLALKARQHIAEWQTDDEIQMARIVELRQEFDDFLIWLKAFSWPTDRPFMDIFHYAQENYHLEMQLLLESLMIELFPKLVDELADILYADEALALDAKMTLGTLMKIIKENYQWALKFDFNQPDAQYHFWYYSEEKLEPRFGVRHEDEGADLEMPLAIARDVQNLLKAMKKCDPNEICALFLMKCPEYRNLIKRVQLNRDCPYSEITDNLIDKDTRPIDILRFKLAYFGASKFDPKSHLWTRINMYQGAPLPDEINKIDPDDWAFAIQPK